MKRFLLFIVLCVPSARAAEPVTLVDGAVVPGARQPQVAVAPSGTVHVVYGARSGIYALASTDGGATFGGPVLVGQPTTFALGMRRGPRIAATDTAVVVTAIGGEQGGGRDGDVLAYRSADGGKTWSGPVTVNTVKASAREGLHHMAAAPDGTIHVVWLDLRNDRMEIWGAASRDGASWTNEKVIYSSPEKSVCTCCQPQVTCDPQGGIHVMWRNDLAKARDMYLVSSKDGGKTFGEPTKLGQGTWVLDRCPMDGGGLAVSDKGEIETIWMRKGEIFRARPGSHEESLGKGEQGWAAAGADGFYLVWLDGQPGALLARVPGSDRPLRLARGAWGPVVAAPVHGKGPVIAVWEEGNNKGPMRLRAMRLSRGS